MKKLILLLLFIQIFSCGLSTQELQVEVKGSIIETLKENPEYDGFEVKDFTLIHKGGNEYIGLLDVIEPNAFAEAWNLLLDENVLSEKGTKATYDVDVIYDGQTFTWKIKD